MKNKKKYFEEEVVMCIKNKVDANPYICLSDITSHLFLLKSKSLGENPSRKIMNKMHRAKKNHAKYLIKGLLSKGIIKIDNPDLGSFICL